MKCVTNCWSGVKTRSEHNVATINKKEEEESVLLSQEMTLPTTKLSFVSLQWELLSMQFPKKSWIACHLVQFSNVKWCFHELSIPKIWQFLHQEFARFFYHNFIIVNYPNVECKAKPFLFSTTVFTKCDEFWSIPEAPKFSHQKRLSWETILDWLSTWKKITTPILI